MRIFYTLALALCPLLCYSQQAITLEQYRWTTQKTSFSLEAKGELAAQREDLTSALKSERLPSLSLSGTASHQNTPGGDALSNTLQASVSLQQDLYDGGLKRSAIASSQIQQQIISENISSARRDLWLLADNSYWAMAWAEQQLKIREQYVTIIDSLERVVSERFEQGLISRTDLLMVQTRLSSAQIELAQAKETYLTTLEDFVQNGGLTTYDVRLVDSLSGPITNTPKVSLDQVLEARPDYREQLSRVSLKKEAIRTQRSLYNPSLVAGVEGVVHNNTSVMPDNFYYRAYLNLGVSVFQWNARRHNVSAASAAMRSEEFTTQDLKTTIAQELNNSYTTLVQNASQVALSQQNLEYAHQNLSLSTFSYSEGSLPIIDVLSSQLSWLDARMGELNSLYNYRLAQSSYKWHSGANFQLAPIEKQ